MEWFALGVQATARVWFEEIARALAEQRISAKTANGVTQLLKFWSTNYANDAAEEVARKARDGAVFGPRAPGGEDSDRRSPTAGGSQHLLPHTRPGHDLLSAVLFTRRSRMGIIQFFQDLFGPRQPCELCRIEADQWEARRSGVADWQIHGHGLQAQLLICESCAMLLQRTGANQKNATIVLGQLIRARYARRPDTRTMLRHREWKKIWQHTLEAGGTTTASLDETVNVVDSMLDEVIRMDLRDDSTGEIRDRSLYALHEAAQAER